VYRKI